MILLDLACLQGPVSPPVKEATTWRDNPVVYTHHARCRMDCRQVSEDEVLLVLKEGVLDPSRTRLHGACPSHALHATTADGQDLRVVFAACAEQTRVVTAIDLSADHDCECD